MNRREFCSAMGTTTLSLICENNVVEESGFVAKLYQNARGQQLSYQLFAPRAYDRRQAYPLVLWLHGGAGRGSDNQKQIMDGNSLGSRVWTWPENQKRNPCFVLKHEVSLWTFEREEGVEPTNNNAERSLRRAVLWRRKSFGTQIVCRQTLHSRASPTHSLTVWRVPQVNGYIKEAR